MVNPYEALPVAGFDSEERIARPQPYVLLLLMWGVFPIGLSFRQLWLAVQNYNLAGHFYSNLIWYGSFEYTLLVTWVIAVLFRSSERPISRVFRAVALLPALSLCVVAVRVISTHLLPGGAFYFPFVMANGDLDEFIVYHSLYAAIFIPVFLYAIMVFRDGYAAFHQFDWHSRFTARVN